MVDPFLLLSRRRESGQLELEVVAPFRGDCDVFFSVLVFGSGWDGGWWVHGTK